MNCIFCDSKQKNGFTELTRKISKGEFLIVNVPALVCINHNCNHVVIESDVVKKMQLLRSEMIKGEFEFAESVDFSQIA